MVFTVRNVASLSPRLPVAKRAADNSVTHRCILLDAADVQHFSTLSQLTHLDLGCAEGVAALAGQLLRLQSLALRYPHPPATVSD
jgi:hypothetical protein